MTLVGLLPCVYLTVGLVILAYYRVRGDEPSIYPEMRNPWMRVILLWSAIVILSPTLLVYVSALIAVEAVNQWKLDRK